ncbi:hypothetical protein [Brevibacillus laterosporus]|uniref:hypothetical protein n=1 Tax=Brevibacillus laterosporus TaxID=1465 RepID=UPI003D1FC314
MRELIDSIFAPVDRFFDMAINALGRFSIQQNRLIDLDSFFAPFSILGDSWVFLIKTVFATLFSVTAIFVVIQIRNLYLSFKEGVRWW